MPNQPVRDKWECLRKMERHFPIKPGQPIGMALVAFYSFSEFPGCFPLCQTDRSEINGNIVGKWNDIFRLNRANQQEWLLPLFIPFPNSLIRAKNRFVKNGTANFGRNIPTEISGPPPEVIPNIPVGRNRNGPFHLISDRNFRNLWHNGKHPRSCCYDAADQ